MITVMRFFVTVALLTGLAASPITASVLISVEPSDTSTILGGAFTVLVDISGVTDLYAYQLDLMYSPAVLAVQSVTEDAFLAQGGSTFFVAGTIDNVGGDVSNNADTLETAISGVSGGGILLDFDFLAVGPGTSDVDLANVELLDSNLNDIAFTTQDSSVSVTPEPSAAELLLFGLFWAFWACRRNGASPAKLTGSIPPR
jgi:hypothetical protein